MLSTILDTIESSTPNSKSAIPQVTPKDNPQVTPQDSPQDNPQDNPQDSPQDSPQIVPQDNRTKNVLINALLAVMQEREVPLNREELQQALNLKDRKSFRARYLKPALDAGLIEMTIPDKPNSKLQRYRLVG